MPSKLVAEVNQGGDLVKHGVEPDRSDASLQGGSGAARERRRGPSPLRHSMNKGRVHGMLAGSSELEDQMCKMTVRGYDGKGSPDRVDALVWAMTELLLDPAAQFRRPTIRTL